MDSYAYVAARASVYLMEHPEVNRCISWATTLYPYAALAVEKVDFPFGSEIDILPDPGREALDNLRETLEIFNGPTGPTPPTGPVPEQEAAVYIGGPEVEAEISKLQDEQGKELGDQTSLTTEHKQEAAVDIGGPGVEAEITEIRKLQDGHEKQLADQTAQMAEARKLMVERYPNSPDGVEDPNLKKFDEVAKLEQDRRVAGQKAELQKLQERQMSNPPDPSRNR
jgi:hypothetical protein